MKFNHAHLRNRFITVTALATAFIASRENVDDDCEEVKYQIRGQDYAIDLCGTLDVMKPVVTLMIKSQRLNVSPWKIAIWFPRLIFLLNQIEEELQRLHGSEIRIPNELILPKLAANWLDLTHNNIDDCQFKGMQVLEGWLVVNQETTTENTRQPTARRKTVFE